MNLTRSYRRGIGRVYIDEDKREYPSVTTVLGSTLKPGVWLESWQKRMMRDKFHEMYEVAALKGAEPEEVYEIHDAALAYPNKYRDNAGAVGTRIHKALEAYFTDQPVSQYITEDPRIKGVLKAAAVWEAETQLEPVNVEYYLASQKHNYAGTVDLICHQHDNRQLSLIDFKSGSVQPQQLLQLAAYSIAYQEQNGQRPDTAMFVKVDIEKGTIKEVEPKLSYHEISQYFDLFLKALSLWKWRTLKQF